MDLLTAIRDLGIVLTFMLLAFIAAEMQRSVPRTQGVKVERWRIMLAVTMLVSTATLVVNVASWRR